MKKKGERIKGRPSHAPTTTVDHLEIQLDDYLYFNVCMKSYFQTDVGLR